MRYEFPTQWRINVASTEELASALNRDQRWLRQFEGKIPSQYHNVPTEKKNGEIRWLSVPSNELKELQRTILINLLRLQFPAYIQGGVRDRSIVTNASLHRKKKWVACLDISKFFPSIHHSQIREIFLGLGCSQKVATTLAHFTSYKYELPQGAPTSPSIANLMLYNFDIRIQKLCQIRRLTYSRYFDDITISANRNLDADCSKVMEIARHEGFKIHKADANKFRQMCAPATQIVTGVIVNRKRLEPSDKFIRELETMFEGLKDGYSPTVDMSKVLAKANGMVSFLNSVDAHSAAIFKRKLGWVNWAKYGFG